jgi:hypothetical protein
MTKKKSSQEIASENVKKLENWLKARPHIPTYHGNVNKAEICRVLGITKSTIGTNPKLRELFSDIELMVLTQEQNSIHKSQPSTSNISDSQRKFLKEKDHQIHWLKKELNKANARNERLRKEAAVEELLVFTGRYVCLATNLTADTTSSYTTDKDIDK